MYVPFVCAGVHVNTAYSCGGGHLHAYAHVSCVVGNNFAICNNLVDYFGRCCFGRGHQRPGAGGPSLSPVVSARNWPYSGISTAVTMKLTLRERAGAGETGQGRALGAWMFLTAERAQGKAVPEVCFR